MTSDRALQAVRTVRSEIESRPYSIPWWLNGAHRQTMWSPVFRRKEQLRWKLRPLATPDDDELRLHFAGQGTGPTVLLLHGLEGSVRSNYIGGQAARFVDRGWTAAVMEFRTCGGIMNRGKRMYHLGETSDLDLVVGHLAEQIDRRLLRGPLYLSGVSLGGNVIAKWLGEAPNRVPSVVAGAAAVSLPFDLEVSGPTIDHALGGFYTWRFLRTLRQKAVAKEAQYPGCVDRELVERARTFVEFDTHGTARLHGFADAWDYWRQSSCGQFLPAIQRPFLLIASQDDPFNPGAAIPHQTVQQNPWLVGQFPERGGHVGFVGGKPWRTTHWSEEQVERFFVGLERQQSSR